MIFTRQQLEFLIKNIGQPQATEIFKKIFYAYCKFLNSNDVKELYDNDYIKSSLDNESFYINISEDIRCKCYNKPAYDYLLSKKLNNSKILDIGCGTGKFLISIAKMNKSLNAVGIDFSSAAIENANRQKNNLNLSNCNFYNCDVSDFESKEIFNYIILNDVTEHLSDLELTSLFQSIKKTMNADSVILIHTPNGFALCYDTSFSFLQSIRKKVKEFIGGGWIVPWDIEQMYYQQVHINVKTYKELNSFLKKIGFISKVKYDEPFVIGFLSYLFSSNMLVIAKRKG